MSHRFTYLLLGIAALSLIFWLYGQSDLVIMLSDQRWACL